LESVSYKTKKSALKAKFCYQCLTEMDDAFVVLTVHRTPKSLNKLHYPICSPKCLENLQEMIIEMAKKNKLLRELLG
jgi:hypothetical protein